VSLFAKDSKVAALEKALLFEALSKKDLTRLATITEDMEVPAETVLCREGALGQEFFVIMDGEAEVTRDGETVAMSGRGDFFGEIALVDDVPRTATVTAKTPLRFFVLTRHAFHQLMRESPDVERQVLQALARRVVALSSDPSLA
jgi:CRP-like cAMP-binding protein